MTGSIHGPSLPISFLASDGPQLPGSYISEGDLVPKDGLDDAPRRFDPVFAREQLLDAVHGVGEQALVGRPQVGRDGT